MKKKIPVIIVLILLITFTALYCSTHEYHTDVERYGKWSEQDRQGKLSVFPDTVENMQVEEYLYQFSTGLLDSNYQIFLKSKLSKAEYQKEVKRLENISDSLDGKTQKIHLDNTSFCLPAYVTICNFDFTYEYALVDEENTTIYYVYLQFIDKENIKFDKELLPENYLCEEKDKIFSIYAYPLENGTGWEMSK